MKDVSRILFIRWFDKWKDRVIWYYIGPILPVHRINHVWLSRNMINRLTFPGGIIPRLSFPFVNVVFLFSLEKSNLVKQIQKTLFKLSAHISPPFLSYHLKIWYRLFKHPWLSNILHGAFLGLCLKI